MYTREIDKNLVNSNPLLIFSRTVYFLKGDKGKINMFKTKILLLALILFIVDGCSLFSGKKKQQAKEKSVEMISNIRDEYLVNQQKLRKKFEKKIR